MSISKESIMKFGGVVLSILASGAISATGAAYFMGSTSAKTEARIANLEAASIEQAATMKKVSDAMVEIQLWRASTDSNRFTSQDANDLYASMTKTNAATQAKLSEFGTQVAVLVLKIEQLEKRVSEFREATP